MTDSSNDIEAVVDGWARAATASLERTVARRSTPPLRLSADKSWARPAFALATTAALIVGLVAIVGSRDESPATDRERDPRWIVTELPDGWGALSAAGPDSPIEPSATGLRFVDTRVYATSEEPAGPIVAISWQPETDSINQITPGAGFAASNYRESVLDGRRIVFADGPSGQRFLYVEVGDQWALVQARGLEDAQLETIASALDVDAANRLVFDPGAIRVVGMTYQGNAPIGAIAPAPGSTMSAYGAQSSTSYDPLGRMSLQVTNAPSAVSAWLRLESDEMTPIDIDGVSGFEFGFAVQGTTSRTIYWQRDGLDFAINGENVDRAALLAGAASVRPATEEEWSRLLAGTAISQVPEGTAVPSADDDEPPADTVALAPVVTPVDVAMTVDVVEKSSTETTFSGTLPEGTPWSVDVVAVADNLRIELFDDGAGGGGFSIRDLGTLDQRAFTIAGGGEMMAIAATVDNPDAATMRVTRRSGDRYTVDFHELRGKPGVRIAAVAVPDNDFALAEVLDATGQVIESAPGPS
ncbi:MAG TPA: hypothetical protein VNO51_19065 [Ilumatobacteraceae bacterium]|nr:hypothetical protein [Ilumatobacteraceae bacterium]